MDRFTPGPWVATKAKWPQDGEYDYAISAEGKVIAEAFGRVAEGDEGLRPAEANAHLIAAAPELFSALDRVRALKIYDKWYLSVSGGNRGFWSVECPAEMTGILETWVPDRDAAIAKAEGRS